MESSRGESALSAVSAVSGQRSKQPSFQTRGSVELWASVLQGKLDDLETRLECCRREVTDKLELQEERGLQAWRSHVFEILEKRVIPVEQQSQHLEQRLRLVETLCQTCGASSDKLVDLASRMDLLEAWVRDELQQDMSEQHAYPLMRSALPSPIGGTGGTPAYSPPSQRLRGHSPGQVVENRFRPDPFRTPSSTGKTTAAPHRSCATMQVWSEALEDSSGWAGKRINEIVKESDSLHGGHEDAGMPMSEPVVQIKSFGFGPLSVAAGKRHVF